jgi:hypothetical protein
MDVTRIPSNIQNMIERAIYLPMAIAILHRDITIIKQGPFKLKDPYIHLIEQSLKLAQKDLSDVKQELRKKSIRIRKVNQEEGFTKYSFLYNGYEELHNYFNPRIREQVNLLLEYYLFKAEPS